MNIYIKREIFFSKTAFIVTFLTLSTCIFLPIFMIGKLYNFVKFIYDLSSEPLALLFFLIMIFAPIIMVLFVIYVYFKDINTFNKCADGIKAITLKKGSIILHCNNTEYDKTLRHCEINCVKILGKKMSIATPLNIHFIQTARLIFPNHPLYWFYEFDVIFEDKNNQKYKFTIPSHFGFQPYKTRDVIIDYLKSKKITLKSSD